MDSNQGPRIQGAALPLQPVPGGNVRGLTGLSSGMYGAAVMSATQLIAAINAEENGALSASTNDTPGTVFNRLVGRIWIVTMELTLPVFNEYVHFTEEPSEEEWAFIEARLQIANTYFFDHVFGEENLAICGHLSQTAWNHLDSYHIRQRANYWRMIPLTHMDIINFMTFIGPYFRKDEYLALLGPLKHYIDFNELYEQNSLGLRRKVAGQDLLPAQESCLNLFQSLGQFFVTYCYILWTTFRHGGLMLASVGEYNFPPTARLRTDFAALYADFKKLALIPLAYNVPVVEAWSVGGEAK
ncbi:hypothetical protein DPSP01_009456 [Paraphaeosphaeria sporulosa]